MKTPLLLWCMALRKRCVRCCDSSCFDRQALRLHLNHLLDYFEYYSSSPADTSKYALIFSRVSCGYSRARAYSAQSCSRPCILRRVCGLPQGVDLTGPCPPTQKKNTGVCNMSPAAKVFNEPAFGWYQYYLVAFLLTWCTQYMWYYQ